MKCCGTPVQCEHPDTECLIRQAHQRQAAERPIYHPLTQAEVLEARVEGAAGALATQVGGDHYKGLKIQPAEYMHANAIPFIEGSVIKYMTRWRDKGGVKDLEKAKHFIDILIELEKGNS